MRWERGCSKCSRSTPSGIKPCPPAYIHALRTNMHAETFIQSETRVSLCSWVFACFPLAQSRVRSAPLIWGVALGPPSSHPTSRRLGHQASTSAPRRSHATTHKFLIIYADSSGERAGPLGVDDGLPRRGRGPSRVSPTTDGGRPCCRATSQASQRSYWRAMQLRLLETPEVLCGGVQRP